MCQFVEKDKKIQVCQICKIVPKIAKCINLSRNTKKNPSLTNLHILEIRKIFPKVTKWADSWRIRIRKNPSLRNLKIFIICKIILQFAKCADSWRNITEKSQLATRDTSATHSRMKRYKQLTISSEIQKLGQIFFFGFVGNFFLQRCFNRQ